MGGKLLPLFNNVKKGALIKREEDFKGMRTDESAQHS